MSDHTPCVFTDNSVELSLPNFDISNPRVWFIQVEATFRCRKITSQSSMFSYVVSRLPVSIASEVIDILDPMPVESPYDKLKAAILKRTTASDEARLQQLLSGVELGDRTPSQLLRHMRSLVGSSKLDDSILRQLWTKCLPANITAILSVLSDDITLEKLAEAADKTHECFFKSTLNHLTESTTASSSPSTTLDSINDRISRLELSMSAIRRERTTSRRSPRDPRRSTSRSRQRSYCYFHRRFGKSARNCRPGCKYPKGTSISQPGNAKASQ
ncbi:unnamed protein product [Dicrocoelium dendriticum]|nr:unnamed protein product [Dicrocoelium dendriticum]